MIEWGEALGILIGGIVGGVFTGGVSYLLDRQRHEHDDRVRREHWQREDALRADQRLREDALQNRSHLRDLYVRAFDELGMCEAAVVSMDRRVAAHSASTSPAAAAQIAERLASNVGGVDRPTAVWGRPPDVVGNRSEPGAPE